MKQARHKFYKFLVLKLDLVIVYGIIKVSVSLTLTLCCLYVVNKEKNKPRTMSGTN